MSASSADEAGVHIDDVTVEYHTGDGVIRALSSVSLDVVTGQTVALVGSSGAGKSTLLGLIAGLVAPTSGSISVLGRDLERLRGAERRRHRSEVGFVPQAHGLPGALRVIHNVNGGMLGSWSSARALRSLVLPSGRAEVDAVLNDVGLDGLADRRTGDLSGGQQQRVAVARVLRQRPRLILADEPVSAVDPRLSADVAKLLRSDGDRRTTVMSLHDPDLARRRTDRIVGLRNGRVAFDLASADVSDRLLTDLYRSA